MKMKVRTSQDRNEIVHQRRLYDERGAKARTFLAGFNKAGASEIAARLYNNKHPFPLEYLLELWREHHIDIPVRTVIDVVHAYNALLAKRAG